MISETSLRHAVELLLSPLEEPFRRYLDVCDDIHACDAAGNTLLHWAAALGSFSAAYALLQRGVEVNALNAYGATPLVVAAALCPNVATMGYLLVSHGAALHAVVATNADENRDNNTASNADSITIQTLLEGRQLQRVWEWLLDFKQVLDQQSNSGLGSFDSRKELPKPSGNGIHLLCSLSDFKHLQSTSHEESSNIAAVSVPRPPPRRQRPELEQQRRSVQVNIPGSGSVSPAVNFEFKQSGNTTPVCTDYVTLSELVEAREIADRLQVEKDQLESFLYLYAETTAFSVTYNDSDEKVEGSGEDSHWSNPSEVYLEELGREPHSAALVVPAAAAASPIEAVLGERIDAQGRRHLLVRFHEPQGKDGQMEAWYLANSLACDPVVRAHLDRTYSATASADTCDGRTPSMMTLRNAGSPLDTWEREQLEAQLRLLPHRMLHSQDDGPPLYPHTPSIFLASPNGRSPKHASTPSAEDYMWQEQQRPQQLQFVSRTGSNGNDNSGVAVAVVPGQPSPSNASLLPEDAEHSMENNGFPRRTAPRKTRLYDSLSYPLATPNTGSDTASRQLLLSDGWQGMQHIPDALVEGNEEKASFLRGQTRQPLSVKSTAYTSDCSSDTMASVSPTFSTAPTKAPTTYNSSTADQPSINNLHSYLTASQKADYNNYLYGAALRILERQQRLQRRELAQNKHTS